MKPQTKKLLWELVTRQTTPEELVKDWATDKVCNLRNPLKQLTDELRYQHLIMVGGSGCGKSTWFQQFMVDDIKRAKKAKCTVIHIDPVQANDLIIKHAGVERYKNAILIDVADVDSLPCLDVFETSSVRDERLRTSNLIGVFTAVCAGLVDATLTSPMKTLFSYCAQIAVRMETPGLRDLLEMLTDPMKVLARCEFGPGDQVYEFFLNEVVGAPGFKGRLSMRDTASALRSRVHACLADPIIERLFCTGKPTLNLIEAINKGSMIFVATRKGDLTMDGARLLGNYILTITHRAMQERVAMDPADMMPTFLYYDEVQNAMTGGSNEILAEMLDEDRKYKLSVNMATTRFGLINPSMGDAILSCTETKIIGKMSMKGAASIAIDLFGANNNGIEKLTELGNYEFYCRVKTLNNSAVYIKTTKDPIKKLGRENRKAIEVFRERMSIKYGQQRIERELLAKEAETATIESADDAPINSFGAAEKTDPLNVEVGAL